jgi:hypothetical protein
MLGPSTRASPLVAHGAGGIEDLGLPERAGDFAVIEAERLDQAVIQQPLGLRRGGGDRVMTLPDSGEKVPSNPKEPSTNYFPICLA